MSKSSLYPAALFGPLLFVLLSASETLSADESLAAVVRPILPDGWTLAENGNQITLERKEKIRVFGSLSLPHFKSNEERLAYVKPHVRYEKLVISLWLGKRMDPAEFKRTEECDLKAVERARNDRKDGKFQPDDEFWKQHPEYGYVPLPILDTGTQSVYMDCPSSAIVRPTSEQRGHTSEFFDKDVGQECQGVIDALGKIYTPY